MKGGTLEEAGTLPAVGFRHGVALAVGRMVARRYLIGESESLVELWNHEPEAYEARAELVDAGLVLAGASLAERMGTLAFDGSTDMPVLLTQFRGQVLKANLVVPDSDRAVQLFQDACDRELVVLVCNIFTIDARDGRQYSAIAVLVGGDGQELFSAYVPYVVKDGTVDYPHGVQFDMSFDHRYGPARAQRIFAANSAFDQVSAAFFDSKPKQEDVRVASDVTVNIPEGLTPEQEIENFAAMMGQAVDEPEPVVDGDLSAGGTLADLDPDRMEPLAHGPIALFLLVAAADGNAETSEVEAFLSALSESPSTLLQGIFVSSEATMDERVKRLMEDRVFLTQSLEALTRTFNEVSGGAEAKAELVRIIVAVVEADGDFDAD